VQNIESKKSKKRILKFSIRCCTLFAQTLQKMLHKPGRNFCTGHLVQPEGENLFFPGGVQWIAGGI